MTAPHQLPPAPRDTVPAPVTVWSWIAIIIAIAFFLSVGAILQYRLGNGDQSAAPGMTQIRLPAAACPQPEVGEVLVITVIAPAAPGQALRGACQMVAGRTI